MQLKGKLHVKFDTQQVTATFRKREFVVEYADHPLYPQYVLFQLVQDRCVLLDQFNPGDEIEVHFSIRGRQWNAPTGQIKYFNSLEAWRIIPATPETPTAPPPQTHVESKVASTNVDDSSDDNEDDLPF